MNYKKIPIYPIFYLLKGDYMLDGFEVRGVGKFRSQSLEERRFKDRAWEYVIHRG